MTFGDMNCCMTFHLASACRVSSGLPLIKESFQQDNKKLQLQADMTQGPNHP